MRAIEVMSEPAGACPDSAGTQPPASRARSFGPWTQLLRIVHTARYFRSGQIARRLAAAGGRRVTRDRPVDRFAPSVNAGDFRLTDGLCRVANRHWSAACEDGEAPVRAAGICDGNWEFLGEAQHLGLPLVWRSSQLAGMPRLWQFHLQYHEWLLEVAAANNGGPKAWEFARQWLQEFGECSEREAGDAWHPFCISRRIPAWLTLWAVAAPPDETQNEIVRSIAAQAAYLMHRLERDLGGNHLLENARALVLAGTALRNAAGDRWLDVGMRIVDVELPRQVLPHGEHFERSPMYHCEMTAALEDIIDATAGLCPEFSARCAEAVGRMRTLTAAIRHPDGDISLLGDSVLAAAPPSAGHPEPQPAGCGGGRIGDYWVWRERGNFLLFDAGPVGPDHLPAHAHADLLTIEASCEGVRFIVDSGVHDYEDSDLRQYCRSTAAHNVLEIDGENQCDVYSRFRMGRRGWPSALLCGSEDGVDWASATHDAYRHLAVERVGRWVGCRTDGDWLIADWATGRDRMHTVVNRLHLHPEVQVRHLSPTQLLLERNGVRRWLNALGNGRLQVVRGWYCPQFGKRIVNQVVEFRAQVSLPVVVGWQIGRSFEAPRPTLNLHGGALSVLNWDPACGSRQLLRIQ